MLRPALPIRLKVPAAVIGLGLLVAGITLALAWLTLRDLAAQEAEAGVARILRAEEEAIARWLADTGAGAAALAASPTVAKSLGQ